MRLWHIDLIPYLPKSQLLAQWRELNSIFKKKDNHILINYVYGQDAELYAYTKKIIEEMFERRYSIKSYENFKNYFKEKELIVPEGDVRFKEHDDKYLTICYWNLTEKYIRGQKDFTDDVYEKIYDFYIRKIEGRV